MKVWVNYNDARWRKYKINFEKIVNASVRNVRPDAEVSITLTNDAEIKKINKQYRDIDKPTNVLSFELGDDVLLGDIYISLDTVMREAESENISVENHTTHMVVHGMLHLQGYDHVRDDDAVIMENQEIKILKKLHIKNPYTADSCTYSDTCSCPGDKFIAFFNKIKIRPDGFWQYVIMALCGAIAAFGFAPFNLWWATLIAIGVAYYLMTRGYKKYSVWGAWLRAAPFGAAYAIAMFWWVINSIYVVPELAAQFAIWTIPALIGIGLVGAIIFSIPFVVVMCVRTVPACRAILFAAVWTLVLWLREWVFTGFPWNPIANITMPFPELANSMSVWGALGLSFIIVGLIASVVDVIARRGKMCWFPFIIFLSLLICGGFIGYKNIKYSQCDGENYGPVIRIVQPARSASQKATHSRSDAIRNANENVRAMIALATAPGAPDLIVFPETSYPFVITDGDNMPIAHILKSDILIGATTYSDGLMYNSLISALPSGQINHIYSKSHLVPFGEYRPFGDIIPTPGQLTPGTGPEIMTINGFNFAPAICYEIVFSDSLIPVNENPNAIVNITNDTWFGTTPGTYQHLDMVRRYAIESGVPIVRANYSGISAFVNSDGEISSFIPVGVSGYADGTVCGAHRTAYRAIGRDGWMIIILLFSCICVMFLKYRCEENKPL